MSFRVDDDRSEPEIYRPWVAHDDETRKKRLYRLIQADCTLAQMAKDLGLSLQYTHRLIKRAGLWQAWQESQERRKLNKVKKPYSKHALITSRALEAYAAKGYDVKWQTPVKESYIEGMPVIVFAPTKLKLRKYRNTETRYWHIKSRFFDRFIIVILPNGRMLHFWPRESKDLYISDAALDLPETWPSKREFQERKKNLRVEQQLKEIKPEAEWSDVDHNDLMAMLGILEKD